MTQRIINVYKPIGYTPYQMVQRFKSQYPEYTTAKIGYAGRLDPMAEGVLLLLVGDTNKNKKQFEGLDKTYTFEALFGLETDSYDLLGKINLQTVQKPTITRTELVSQLSIFKGDIVQTYPPFSSVRIKGKPLLYWAFHNKLADITLPQKKVTITAISLQSLHTISAEHIYEIIVDRVKLVEGNFRQEKIISSWKLFLEQNRKKIFPLVKVTISCSSGTYVRSLVHELGEKLKIPATTFSITRTQVGTFTLRDSLLLN